MYDLSSEIILKNDLIVWNATHLIEIIKLPIKPIFKLGNFHFFLQPPKWILKLIINLGV